jgi:hypothetical protein
MARASTPTLLSLDKFAKLLAISPVHFSGASGQDVWMDFGDCQDVWPQYAWQVDTEIASREEVALAIANAEQDIANALGYWPAPVWIEGETHPWGRYGALVNADWGKIIAPGRRGATEIDDAAAVTFSDPDGDGWNELATVTVTTDVTERQEIKLYTTGYGSDPAWEIRPLRDVVIAGGTATITAPSWLFIDPALWERYPSGSRGFEAIDISNTSNYVNSVEVWRIFNDTTEPGSQFYSGNIRLDYSYYACANCSGQGCQTCGVTVTSGCFSVIDNRTAALRPYPATYADGAWVNASFSCCANAHQVGINYYSGEVDQRYRKGQSLDPLNDYWAETITWLATARLPKGICGCGRAKERIAELQRDASMFREQPNSAIYTRFEKMSIFESGFGTRVGEVKAWDRVTSLVGDQVWSAGVL